MDISNTLNVTSADSTMTGTEAKKMAALARFKAMEADFKGRAEKRRKARVVAEELKIKGNDALKRGLYKSAKKYYSDALD